MMAGMVAGTIIAAMIKKIKALMSSHIIWSILNLISSKIIAFKMQEFKLLNKIEDILIVSYISNFNIKYLIFYNIFA